MKARYLLSLFLCSGSVGVYASGGTAVYAQSTVPRDKAGQFFGYNAPSLQACPAPSGLYAQGGNGDTTSPTQGGLGLIAFGSSGGVSDGVGGVFQGELAPRGAMASMSPAVAAIPNLRVMSTSFAT